MKVSMVYASAQSIEGGRLAFDSRLGILLICDLCFFFLIRTVLILRFLFTMLLASVF